VQFVHAVAPEDPLNWPIGQSVQTDWPVLPLNVPAVQFVHAVAPFDELNCPNGQLTQLVAPWELLNVPGLH
jgi:hypothetical protein